MDPTSLVIMAMIGWTAASAGWIYRHRRQKQQQQNQQESDTNSMRMNSAVEGHELQEGGQETASSGGYKQEQQWIRHKMNGHYQSRSPGA